MPAAIIYTWKATNAIIYQWDIKHLNGKKQHVPTIIHILAARCCQITFPVWVKAPSPQLRRTYCHWLLSRARLCWLAGTSSSHLQLAHYLLHVPPPTRLWNKVEQWRNREEGNTKFVFVRPAFSVWMCASVCQHVCVHVRAAAVRYFSRFGRDDFVGDFVYLQYEGLLIMTARIWVCFCFFVYSVCDCRNIIYGQMCKDCFNL